MAGKGDKRRPGDSQKYRDEHDRIFNKEKECLTPSSGDTGNPVKPKDRKHGRRQSAESS